MRKLIALGALLLLAACNKQEMMEKFSSPADQAQAKSYVDDLRSGKLDAIESASDPSIQSPQLHHTLEQMAALFPAGEPVSVTLVGAYRMSMSSLVGKGKSTTATTSLEYDFGGKWMLVSTIVKEHDGVRSLMGFHVQPEAQPLEVQNRFTLGGKSGLHYVVLGAAVAAALLSLVALVVCIRTPLRRRKWLWVLFILFGFGKVSLNWTTGQWGATPLSVQLFSASAMSQFYGPWIVSLSLPIGAVLFLTLRRQLMRETELEAAPPPAA